MNRLPPLSAALALLVVSDAIAVELIAHRGYTCRAVENTIAAVNDAWLAQADAVELDLNVSSDGVIVVFHDKKIGRRRVAGLTFTEIQEATDYAVPTLASVLALEQPRGYYVLDLKAATPGSYRHLAQLVSAANVDPTRLVIQSRYLDALVEVREALPAAKFHYVARLRRRPLKFRTPRAGSILASIDGYELDGVSLKGRKAIDASDIEQLHKAGLRVFVWTLNEPTRALHYQRLGVDGIITDALPSLRTALDGDRATPSPCSANTEAVKSTDSAKQ